jgi:copper chaperone CopZ
MVHLKPKEFFMDETNTVNIKRPVEPVLETKDVAIAGMTSDACVKIIERALRKKDGVTEVRVDRDRSVATVTYDTRKTDIPALHDALLKSGYHPTREAEQVDLVFKRR